jgi:hypothetical protein
LPHSNKSVHNNTLVNKERGRMESEESSGKGSGDGAPESAIDQVGCSAGDLPYLESWIPSVIETAEVGGPMDADGDEEGNLQEMLQWLAQDEAGDGETGHSQSAVSEPRLGSLEPETSTANEAAAAAAAAAAVESSVALLPGCLEMESAVVLLPGCLEMESAVVSLPGREKAVGTCHKCGAGLTGIKPSARCTGCGAGFHTTDCGSRLAKLGLDLSLLTQCPRCTCVCQCSGGDIPCHAHAMKKRRRDKHPAATSAAVPTTASCDAPGEELQQLRAENVSLRAALRDALKVTHNLTPKSLHLNP